MRKKINLLNTWGDRELNDFIEREWERICLSKEEARATALGACIRYAVYCVLAHLIFAVLSPEKAKASTDEAALDAFLSRTAIERVVRSTVAQWSESGPPLDSDNDRVIDSLDNNPPQNSQVVVHQGQPQQKQTGEGINLSYTINLNLPPTTDVEVFNAIFKSLKQHLLQN